MKKYIIKRILISIPMIFLITFIAFCLINLIPSDPAEVAIRVNDVTPTPELIEQTRVALGLDKPFLERYFIWLWKVLHFDFGISYEPTTAIDSLNQKDIIDEFIILKKELNVSLLFVTHDLGVLTNLADNLIVMQNGEIVEEGTTKEIIINAKNEHTKFLIGTRRALMEKFKKVKEYDK